LHRPLARSSWPNSVTANLDSNIAEIYWQLATGIPLVLLAAAFLISAIRRPRLDWWTIVISPAIVIAWCIWAAPWFTHSQIYQQAIAAGFFS
jgi:hypothetical protein